MAEGGIEPKPSDNQISKLQLEVNECLGNWLVYLQVCMFSYVMIDMIFMIMILMLKYAKTNYVIYCRRSMAYVQRVQN